MKFIAIIAVIAIVLGSGFYFTLTRITPTVTVVEKTIHVPTWKK